MTSQLTHPNTIALSTITGAHRRVFFITRWNILKG